MIVKLTLAESGEPFVFNAEHFVCAYPLKPRVGGNNGASSVVQVDMHAPVEVVEEAGRIFDLVGAEDRHPRPSGSTWVVLAHRSGLATTIFLPGVGWVVAFGADKRAVAFGSWHKAVAAADVAAEQYDCVTEVARLDLILGVSDE